MKKKGSFFLDDEVPCINKNRFHLGVEDVPEYESSAPVIESIILKHFAYGFDSLPTWFKSMLETNTDSIYGFNIGRGKHFDFVKNEHAASGSFSCSCVCY